MAKSIETQLRERIYEVIEKTTKNSSPRIFRAIQSKQGYKKVEELMIRKVIELRQEPEAAITHVEALFEEIEYEYKE